MPKKSNYKEELEILKIEISRFLLLAEKSSFTNKGRLALKVRKRSILLREKLKEFRKLSIEHEKYLKNKYLNMEKNIREE